MQGLGERVEHQALVHVGRGLDSKRTTALFVYVDTSCRRVASEREDRCETTNPRPPPSARGSTPPRRMAHWNQQHQSAAIVTIGLNASARCGHPSVHTL